MLYMIIKEVFMNIDMKKVPFYLNANTYEESCCYAFIDEVFHSFTEMVKYKNFYIPKDYFFLGRPSPFVFEGFFLHGFFHSFFEYKTHYEYYDKMPKEYSVKKDNIVVFPFFTDLIAENERLYFFCGIPVRTVDFGVKLFNKYYNSLNNYDDCLKFYNQYFSNDIIDNNLFFEDILKI